MEKIFYFIVGVFLIVVVPFGIMMAWGWEKDFQTTFGKILVRVITISILIIVPCYLYNVIEKWQNKK